MTPTHSRSRTFSPSPSSATPEVTAAHDPGPAPVGADVAPVIQKSLPPHEYQQRLAIERPAIWRGIVALALLLLGMLFFSIIGGAIGIAIDMATGRWDPSGPAPGMTPAILGGSLAGLAMLMPWSMLLQKWFFKVPMRSLHSVRNLFRWRLFARTALIIVPLWVVYQLLSPLLIPQPTATYPLIEVIALVILAVTLTPLQSAGEKYGFRGLAFRIAASWGLGPRSGLVTGILVSSLLFMAAHFAMDPWLNVYYFVFGASLAIITWRTGGIEIAVLLHAVNNTTAFLLSAIMSYDMTAGFDRSAGVASPVMLVPCAVLVTIAGVVWWRTRDGAARSLPVAQS